MYRVLVLLVIIQTALCTETLQGLQLSDRMFLNNLNMEERPLTLKVFDVLINSMRGLRESLVRQSRGPVTFTLGQATHLHVSDKATVPFRTVINNNTAQLVAGIFTCKSPGFYKFQVYSMTRYNKTISLDVIVNSDKVATLWANIPGEYAGTGNAIIVKLNQNDTVQVSSKGSSEMFGKPEEIYTTFTGIQLKKPGLGSVPLVAFSVVLASHQIIPGGMRVFYNTKHVDTKNAYNEHNGIYTVPSSGVYVFHFFSLAKKGKEVWQDLYRNQEYVCSLYGKMKDEYASAGNTAILRLKRGDHIQVRAHDNRADHLFGKPDQMYTSLSGYQLETDLGADNTVAKQSVYFYVGLSQSTTFKLNEHVVFDRVFPENSTLNYYNNMTGEFIAPKNGTYELNFHALSQKSQTIWLDMYHIDRNIVSLRGHLSDGHAAGGNAAVINLAAGEAVYIRARNTSALYGAPDQIYCTFSGAMLQTGDISDYFAKRPAFVEEITSFENQRKNDFQRANSMFRLRRMYRQQDLL